MMVTGTQFFAAERKIFPDPRWATEDGVLAVSSDLTEEALFEAYSFGIFPWPDEESSILWCSPPLRGVLDFKDLHVTQSLRKFLRKNPYRVTWNQNFSQVIKNCREIHRHRTTGTWITSKMIRAYEKFHQAGWAHSVECWEGEQLVGGLYGVFVAGVFSGESMFYLKPNASKLCLWWLIQKLQEKGITWMDTQMVSDSLKIWGGKYITRAEFLGRLEQAKTSDYFCKKLFN